MALGVLEPKTSVVQGTIQLIDDPSALNTATTTTHLKHSRDGKIVLSPQPSDDPDDPLNWTQWRRDGNYAVILITSILSTIHGPMLAPVTVELAETFHRSINDIAQLSSYMLLVIAGFAYVYSVLTRLYGKRLFFLLSLAIIMASDAWGACATNYNSLFGARILSGAGQAMFEALSLAIIPDLFFLHERGSRVALFLFLSQSGVTLGTPIITQVIQHYSLKSAFIGLAVSEAVMLVVMFFTFYECAYPRDHVDALAHQNEDEVLAQVHSEKFPTHQNIENVDSIPVSNARPLTPRKSYLQKINPYSGKISSQNIFTLSWRTFALTFHPVIFWAAISGLPLSWPVGISFTSASLLTAPPYNFSPTGVGNMFIAAWVGTSIALPLGGTLDRFVLILTRRNHNVYEPEFRLWYTIPSIIFFLIGWIGWGWGAQVDMAWPGLAVMFAFIYIGALLMNVSVLSYIIDAYRMYSVESQVILFSVKNLFPFGMGYFFVPWYFAVGPKKVFGIVGGVVAGVYILTIPMYIFGKHIRSFFMRHSFLGIMDMRE